MSGSEPSGSTSARPRRGLVIVTCKDARIAPLELFGLELGDAHVIRNGGGVVTDDVLRSLAVSHHLMGTTEVRIVGHTECGMATFTDDELRARIGPAADGVHFHSFTDVEDAVRSSVRAVRESPLLPDSFAATGWVYELASGRVREVTP